MRAGERRKFSRNMEYERSARKIAILGLSLCGFAAPIVAIVFAVIALFGVVSGGHNLLRPEHLMSSIQGHMPHAILGTAVVGSLAKIRELREQRFKLVQDGQAIFDKMVVTAEDRAQFDKMMADADVIKADIDRLERVQLSDSELRASGAPPREQIAADVDDESNEVRAEREKLQKKQRAAFRSYLKNGLVADAYGFQGVSDEHRAILTKMRAESRDMGTGGGNALQGTGGGYFVPVGFVNDIEEAMKWYGDMLRSSTIMPTATGQPLPYPTDNDTGNVGELVGEGVQVSTQDVTLGNIVFGAYKFSTKMVKVSIELLQDSAFDIESYLKDKFAIRLGRILNTKFTVGTGTAEPKGIIPASVSGATAAGSAANDGSVATGANSIGTDDLVALEHSVDKAYRRGASWQMNDSTVKALKQLKDKYGRPIWVPALAMNAPDTLLNYPVWTNNDMDAIATTKKTVLFGQQSKYLVRRVKELAVLRLVERFADFGQVAFIGFARYDGNLLDAGTHPVKFLTQA